MTIALGRALDDIWDVPRFEQPGALRRRARGMASLAVVALVLLAASVLPGLALGGGIGPVAQKVLSFLVAIALNAVVFFCVFGLLGHRPERRRALVPGVAVATLGSLVLQSAGGVYLDRVVLGASEIYGSFAFVIGLLSWFCSAPTCCSSRRSSTSCWRAASGRARSRTSSGTRTAARSPQAVEAARLDERQEVVVRYP